jgi:hypothetical protein
MVEVQNKDMHRLYRSPNIIRKIESRILRWACIVARMGEDKSYFKILTGNLQVINLGKFRRTWEDYTCIRVNYKEVVFSVRNVMTTSQDRNYFRIIIIVEPLKTLN